MFPKSSFFTTILISSFFIFSSFSQDYNHEEVQWLRFSAKVEKSNFGKGKNPQQPLFRYDFTTNFPLRDNMPSNSRREILVRAEDTYSQTGSPLFDGILSMSFIETKENSVNYIRDYKFEQVPCNCFETGQKWTYVWTRDISYAVDLSLGLVDPIRSMNSLLFKLSPQRRKNRNTLQIVQDTGTGGSWPISTDRIIWAHAAGQLINYLPEQEKIKFAQDAYLGIKNTIEADRASIFDTSDGLYTGEKSFLDWREQTYPNWVKKNVIHVGIMKSLSTNITHLLGLRALIKLGKMLKKDNELSKYQNWEKLLKRDININFWDQELGQYRALKGTYLDQHNYTKFDLLGNSLAILYDVAETKEQKSSLKNYPMVKGGVSVVWPQDQEVAIYHNRGNWPFVTSYALLAAKKSGLVSIYQHLLDSLLRTAALNLSNMENFEFLSLSNWYNAGSSSGPVVNSQRQLWSVAGMIATQLKGVFGVEFENDFLTIAPLITTKMRNKLFSQTNQLKLNNLNYKNKKIELVINLPSKSGGLDRLDKKNDLKYYTIKSIKVNGKDLRINKSRRDFKKIKTSLLLNSNRIEVFLGNPISYENSFKVFQGTNPDQLDHEEYEYIYAPKTPYLHPIKQNNGTPILHFNKNTFLTSYIKIYKDGKLYQNFWDQEYFVDQTHNPNKTACYSVETVFYSSRNHSMPSEPHCYWPPNSIESIFMTDSRVKFNSKTTFSKSYDKVYVKNWGARGDSIAIGPITKPETGKFAFQVSYSNLGHINTGITAIVKKIELRDFRSNRLIKKGIIQMPQNDQERYWIDSSFFELPLDKNRQYKIVISDHFNMSYFSHFKNYLDRGGKSGYYNRVHLSEFKLLKL